MRVLAQFIVLACLAIALPACGSKEGTDLAISVKNGLGEHRYRLKCDPASGSVPRPAELCGLIRENEGLMLPAPEAPSQVCVGGVLTPYIEIEGDFRGDAIHTVVSSCYGNVEGERLWLKLLPPPVGS